MKILFITSQVFFPPLSGLRKKIFLLLKELKEKNNKIYLFSFPKFEIPDNYFERVEFSSPLSKFVFFKNLFFSFLKNPFEIVFYINPKSFKRIKNFVKEVNPDIIFVDYIRIAHIFPYINFKNKKLILNMDDPQSLKYIKMKSLIKDIENPFGEALEDLPILIKKILKNNFVKKLILSYEIKMMQKYEKKWTKSYDLVLTNSEKDKMYLNSIGIKNVNILPPLVKIDEDLKIEEKENYILFVGKMDYAPNPDAVNYFLKKIFPYVREVHPEVWFYIIGSNINKDLEEKWKKEKNVKVIGRVPDVEVFYKRAKVFVSPLRFGTGIKVKILEAMSYGAPVVTTKIGAEGMKVLNRKHLLIAEDEKDFALKVIELIENKSLCENIVKNAFKFVRENYDIKKWTKKIFNF
ncbi:MAG: glycosyltransferase family 4 protein [candidate division WOR-3 bacterium]